MHKDKTQKIITEKITKKEETLKKVCLGNWGLFLQKKQERTYFTFKASFIDLKSAVNIRECILCIIITYIIYLTNP